MANLNDFKRRIEQGMQDRQDREAREAAQRRESKRAERAAEEIARPERERHRLEQQSIAKAERTATLAAARYAGRLLTEAGVRPDTHVVDSKHGIYFPTTYATKAVGWLVVSRQVEVGRATWHGEDSGPVNETWGLVLTNKGNLVEFRTSGHSQYGDGSVASLASRRQVQHVFVTDSGSYHEARSRKLGEPGLDERMPLSSRDWNERVEGDEQWIIDALAQTVVDNMPLRS